MNLRISNTLSLLTVVALAASCGKSSTKTEQSTQVQAVSVSIDTVRKQVVTATDTYPGTLVALNEVELRAEVGGYITRIYVKDGQTVSKGQRLYEIDRSRYDAAYRQAMAGLQIARANRDKVKKDTERYRKLAEQDAIAKQRVDYALTDLANAESQIAASQAAVNNALADLRRSVIVSPMNGTIGISLVKLGALVSPGSTLLNTVSATNPIGVDIQVAQHDIPRFMDLQKNSAANVDSSFVLELSGGQRVAGGKINTVDRAVDTQTGSIKLRLSFPNAQGILLPGMNATVKVLNRSLNEQIVIPFRAVSEQLGEFTVFVLGDSSKVEQKHVKLGAKISDRIVVTEGINQGDVIVTDGTQNLRHGSLVQTGAPAIN